jgi:hypothetical protein
MDRRGRSHDRTLPTAAPQGSAPGWERLGSERVRHLIREITRFVEVQINRASGGCQDGSVGCYLSQGNVEAALSVR